MAAWDLDVGDNKIKYLCVLKTDCIKRKVINAGE